MDDVIRTEGLVKWYGRQRGICGLSFTVHRGEVFGYLGPNGAGKTTTIRLLLDLIRPTSGKVLVLGLDPRRDRMEIHRRIGYLPGELALYANLTGREVLEYLGSLHGGVPWESARRLAAELECDLSRSVRALSHGNRQKIGLVAAFMHSAELLILDEPTLGLDPLVQQSFYRLVREAKADGRTIFLSSHILPEVERVCDRVGIIREGQLVAVEDVAALKGRALRRLEIHFAQPVPGAAFAHVAGVQDTVVENNVLRCNVVGGLDALVKTLAQYPVDNIISHEPSLEEVFLAFYGGGDHHVA